MRGTDGPVALPGRWPGAWPRPARAPRLCRVRREGWPQTRWWWWGAPGAPAHRDAPGPQGPWDPPPGSATAAAPSHGVSLRSAPRTRLAVPFRPWCLRAAFPSSPPLLLLFLFPLVFRRRVLSTRDPPFPLRLRRGDAFAAGMWRARRCWRLAVSHLIPDSSSPRSPRVRRRPLRRARVRFFRILDPV